MDIRKTPVGCEVLMKVGEPRGWSTAELEALRRAVVDAVTSGKRQADVARLFQVSRQAVSKWVTAYRVKGARALRSKPCGRPKDRTLLSSKQVVEVTQTVVRCWPDEVDLPWQLWSRKAIQALIDHRFQIRLSIWTVAKLLAEWGVAPYIPLRQTSTRQSEEFQRWLREDYPIIHQQAVKEHATIFWIDDSRLLWRRSDAMLKTILQFKHISIGFRGSLLAAHTNRGQVRFMVVRERYTATVVVEFLKRLVREADRRVFVLVVDNPIHRTRQVQGWVARHAADMRLWARPL